MGMRFIHSGRERQDAEEGHFPNASPDSPSPMTGKGLCACFTFLRRLRGQGGFHEHAGNCLSAVSALLTLALEIVIRYSCVVIYFFTIDFVSYHLSDIWLSHIQSGTLRLFIRLLDMLVIIILNAGAVYLLFLIRKMIGNYAKIRAHLQNMILYAIDFCFYFFLIL